MREEVEARTWSLKKGGALGRMNESDNNSLSSSSTVYTTRVVTATWVLEGVLVGLFPPPGGTF